MSYSVIENGGTYDILEKDTGIIIELKETNKTHIRSICRKLNLGSGFNGWTPGFFGKKYQQQSC
jgi:hypothetical protein